jgi:hypothetical protein
VTFPGGHEFAFTILDDTDDTTVDNGRPIYDLLRDLGFRTTKTVWALDSPPELKGPYFAAETLQDPLYLEWVHELADAGFEIAFHNASMGSATRDRTIEALELIHSQFPGMPRLHCNHGQNSENLHWGPARYSSSELRLAFRAVARVSGGRTYEGHLPHSPFYWGDVAAARLDFIRRFAFRRLDCGRIPPGAPYIDPRTPEVPCWFNTADAPNAQAFKKLVTKNRIDALRAARSWSVVSTHLGKGFCRDGQVDGEVRTILEYISRRGGWYVPVSELLDHLVETKGRKTLTPVERRMMEYAHVLDRATARASG